MSDTSQGPDWWLASDGKWYPPQSAQPAITTKTGASDPASCWLVIGGSAAVIIGAFLPWATVSFFGANISKAGTSGDGILTLLLCSVSGALGIVLLRGSRRRSAAIWSLALVIVALLIAIYDTADVSRVASSVGAVSVGFGLWLTDVGGVVALVGAFLWLKRTPKVRAT